jgi:predicted regulator of Ras-like GTPase activity (Roadblock/LC7/MglB family)
MSFSEVLKEVVNSTEGALGALIVGLDGIPVEEYAVNSDMDIQAMTVEFSSLLKEIEKGSQSAEMGSTREVTVIADKAMIMLRRLNDEYFFVLILKPEGNFGKGRFLLRISAPRLLKEF